MKNPARGCLILSAMLWSGPIIAAQESRLAASVETDSQTTRVQELWSLIEGQNPPQTRRTGARELFRLGHLTTPARVLAHLASPNQKAVKLALLGGMTDLPDALQPEYIDPLLALLSDTDRELREAVASALAGCRESYAVERLVACVQDAQRSEPVRIAAVDALGRMSVYEAVNALGGLLDSRNRSVARAAAAAVEALSGQDFQQDPAQARQWWTENQRTLPDTWQRMQTDRLSRENRLWKQRFSEVEQRLRTLLSDQFFRAAENDRSPLLLAYLSDSMPVVRLAGLEIVRTLLGEQRTPPPEVIARVRDLLSAPEPSVREAAVRQLVALRDPADGDRLRQLLGSERNRDVREAVVGGLGYLAGSEVVALLLGLVADDDVGIATEAVRSLGRLADRGTVADALRRRIADALQERFTALPTGDAVRREALLRAMSRLRDSRLAPMLASVLAPSEPAAIREAAATGLAALVDPNTPGAIVGEPTHGVTPIWLVQTLAAAVTDESRIVRRAAVNVLSALGSNDVDLEVLWGRIDPNAEPDEAIRQDAWLGVLKLLRSRPSAEIENWLAKLAPESFAAGGTRGPLDLCRLLVDQMERESESPVRVASAWKRVAEWSARIGALPEARAAYAKGLTALKAAQSPETQAVAQEALRFALAHGLYDQTFAETLAELNLDAPQLWATAKDECEKLMNAGNGERAAQAVTRLSAWPPGFTFAAFDQQLEELRAKTGQVRQRGRIEAAVKTLRAKPDDAMAVQRLLAAGTGAVPAICDALREVVSSETSEPVVEQVLCEILRALLPRWPGYPSDAAKADKLKKLDEARHSELSDGAGATD